MEGKIEVKEDFKGFGLNTEKDRVIISGEGEDCKWKNLADGKSGLSSKHFEFEMLIRYPYRLR